MRKLLIVVVLVFFACACEAPLETSVPTVKKETVVPVPAWTKKLQGLDTGEVSYCETDICSLFQLKYDGAEWTEKKDLKLKFKYVLRRERVRLSGGYSDRHTIPEKIIGIFASPNTKDSRIIGLWRYTPETPDKERLRIIAQPVPGHTPIALGLYVMRSEIEHLKKVANQKGTVFRLVIGFRSMSQQLLTQVIF